jgi:hypothetical protein
MKWYRFSSKGLREPRLLKNVWDVSWLGGTGADAGSRERALARWCIRKGYLCVRTVDLFWFLRFRRNGLPALDGRCLREIWHYKSQKHRLLLKYGVWEVLDDGERRLKGQELRDCVRAFHPHPGRWDQYSKNQRRYYARNLRRFESVRVFWRKCPLNAKRAILRCHRYSFNLKPPEAHPDYFVVFKKRGPAFVEVKGRRESLRPSQRKFFPELVRHASQRVFLVRLEPTARRLHWFHATSFGILPLTGSPE